MKIPFLLQDNVLTVVAKGHSFQLPVNNKIFKLVKDALVANDEDKVFSLLDEEEKTRHSQAFAAEKEDKIKTFVGQVTAGAPKVRYTNGQLFYNDEVLHHVIAEKIKAYALLDLPFDSLISFIENLMNNPSKNAVDQLYSFLEHKNLPITEDGCFLAYKAVRNDLTDKHTGKVLNEIGSVIEMPRNRVDDNPSNHCSHGFHAGALGYVKQFGNHASDKFLVVKINPRDVVSIPSDHQCMKLRTCRYEVVSFYDKPLSSVYSDTSPDKWRHGDDDVDFDSPDFDEGHQPYDDYEEDIDDLIEGVDFVVKDGVRFVRDESRRAPAVAPSDYDDWCDDDEEIEDEEDEEEDDWGFGGPREQVRDLNEVRLEWWCWIPSIEEREDGTSIAAGRGETLTRQEASLDYAKIQYDEGAWEGEVQVAVCRNDKTLYSDFAVFDVAVNWSGPTVRFDHWDVID